MDGLNSGPIDRTPGTPGSDKKAPQLRFLKKLPHDDMLKWTLDKRINLTNWNDTCFDFNGVTSERNQTLFASTLSTHSLTAAAQFFQRKITSRRPAGHFRDGAMSRWEVAWLVSRSRFCGKLLSNSWSPYSTPHPPTQSAFHSFAFIKATWNASSRPFLTNSFFIFHPSILSEMWGKLARSYMS